MKGRRIAVFLCLSLLLACSVTARADTGPKPSVRITFTGLEGESYYGTLLSERSSTGPASADRIELHLNSLTAYYGPNNTYTALAVTELGADPGRTFCRFRLTLGGWVTGCCSSSYRTSSQHWSLDTDRRMAELRDSQVETIRVTADEGNLGAGTVLRLYGVKK